MTKKMLAKTSIKVQKFDNETDWLDGRLGKVMGTKAGNLILKTGKGYKKGFYELIAERVAIPANGENVMDRGHRLEDIAIERFIRETGKKVENDLVIWSRSDNENIAISPDGYIGETEAVEVKCLNSASHIEAWLTKKIPSDYEYQALQYFVVNDNLKTLYFTFFDPRMPKDFFYITITREEKEVEIKEQLELEKRILVEVDIIENDLTF